MQSTKTCILIYHLYSYISFSVTHFLRLRKCISREIIRCHKHHKHQWALNYSCFFEKKTHSVQLLQWCCVFSMYLADLKSANIHQYRNSCCILSELTQAAVPLRYHNSNWPAEIRFCSELMIGFAQKNSVLLFCEIWFSLCYR